MKFSRIITARIAFQSVAFSPSSKQIDSSANFTTAGGFAIDLTSTKCCFLIELTAKEQHQLINRNVKVRLKADFL